MSEEWLLTIGVECYAGHRGEQTPRTLMLGDRRIAVAEMLDVPADSALRPSHRGSVRHLARGYIRRLGDSICPWTRTTDTRRPFCIAESPSRPRRACFRYDMAPASRPQPTRSESNPPAVAGRSGWQADPRTRRLAVRAATPLHGAFRDRLRPAAPRALRGSLASRMV
jgi:hypothetical protein